MRRKCSFGFAGGAGVVAAAMLSMTITGVAQAAPVISYSWLTAAIPAPSGNVLETQVVGDLTGSTGAGNKQEQLSPVVSSGYQATFNGAKNYDLSLPTGTYTLSFDFELIVKPDQFFTYMRSGNGGNSLFNGPSLTGLSTSQWYQASATVTVTSGPWAGDTEIGYTEYPHSPAVTAEVLYDNFSFVATGGGSVYEANPISFAGDTAGQPAPSSQIANDNFNTSEVLAVPEPATLVLMAAMGAGLLMVGRKRKPA